MAPRGLFSVWRSPRFSRPRAAGAVEDDPPSRAGDAGGMSARRDGNTYVMRASFEESPRPTIVETFYIALMFFSERKSTSAYCSRARVIELDVLIPA